MQTIPDTLCYLNGKEFLAKYGGFMSEHGHRGHQDRDIWYPRRSVDPEIDLRSLRSMARPKTRHWFNPSALTCRG